MYNQTTFRCPRLVPFIFLACAALAIFTARVRAQSLGTAENFGVLGATTVTNTGATHVSGSVGVSPGSAITGFPPGIITNGALHANDGTATQAHADAVTAYNNFAGLFSPPANNLSGSDLGGQTLIPGVYRYDSSATSGGVLTLDAQSDPNARFVLQIGTTFITSSGSSVLLINGADARNVYFQVGTAVTLASGTSFTGNLMAGTSITAVSGSSVVGRLLTVTGAVTLDTNMVTNPGLSSTPTPTPTAAPTATPTAAPTATPTVAPTATPTVAPTATPTAAPTATPTVAPTATPTATPTSSITPTPTSTPNSSPTATPTATAASTATVTPTPTPISTATPSATTAPTPTPTPTLTAISKVINLSTRMRVQTGDNVAIGGFIIMGDTPKHVIIRAIGPTLARQDIIGALADPSIELHGPDPFVTITNDNWRDTQETEILDTTIPPTDDLESAIVATLTPGAYTVIMTGVGATSGIALVEVYDLNQDADSKLANLSTRALVGVGEDIVIAGFLLSDRSAVDRIIVRGIGPSLTGGGTPNALADPSLELHDTNGALLIANNDWQDSAVQAAEITAAGLAPSNHLESAVAATLPPGLYTALLSGMNNSTGIGVVEVYDRGAPPLP